MTEKYLREAWRIFAFFDAGDMRLSRRLGCAQGLEQNLNVHVRGLESVFS